MKENCDVLELERSGVSLSLQDFTIGCTFQTAIEVLVLEVNEVEEESRLLSDIATESQRLEELELKVFSSSASQHSC